MGHHEPIVSVEQFNAVQSILDARTEQYKSHNRRIGKAQSYLGGFLVCARCGAKYSKTTLRRKRKDGSYWIAERFMCNSKNRRAARLVRDPNCDNKNWDVDELTDLVFGEIKKLALDPAYLEEMQTGSDDSTAEEMEVIGNEIQKVEAQIDRLLDLYTVGSVPVAVVQQRIAALNDQRTKLENQLTELEKKENDRPPIAETMEKARSFGEVLENGDFDQIRAILTDLIAFIEVDGPDVTIHWNFM